jgi:15-cis-phytoene synthase
MSARAEKSSPRVLARLYCPPAQRAAFDALLGIENEIRASLQRGLEHGVAHARLKWWREECARLSHGQPLHPLTRELRARLGAQAGAALAGVQGFVDLAQWDLAAAPFASRAELSAYAQRWSAAFLAPLARLSLPDTPPEPALSLGARLRELELLNTAAADAREGRLRLPLDELEAAGVSPDELQAERFGPALTVLVRAAHLQARAALAAAVAVLQPREQVALPALLVWAALAAAHSRRATHALPGASDPGEHHAALDGWRAWRAGRRAHAGCFSLRAD